MAVRALEHVTIRCADLKATRDNRWKYLGVVNEPCFEKATGPDPDHYGLWLDKRTMDCPPDPYENEEKYPGVKIGARGKNIPVGSYYGMATGIVGLRLFPNPDFDEAAAKKRDAVMEKYNRQDGKRAQAIDVGPVARFAGNSQLGHTR